MESTHTPQTACITCRRCRCPKHHPPGPCGEKPNRGRRFFLLGALFAPVAQRLTDFVGPMGAIGPKAPAPFSAGPGTTGLMGPAGPTGPIGATCTTGNWVSMMGGIWVAR
jgi:hypothetical protein